MLWGHVQLQLLLKINIFGFHKVWWHSFVVDWFRLCTISSVFCVPKLFIQIHLDSYSKIQMNVDICWDTLSVCQPALWMCDSSFLIAVFYSVQEFWKNYFQQQEEWHRVHIEPLLLCSAAKNALKTSHLVGDWQCQDAFSCWKSPGIHLVVFKIFTRWNNMAPIVWWWCVWC